MGFLNSIRMKPALTYRRSLNRIEWLSASHGQTQSEEVSKTALKMPLLIPGKSVCLGMEWSLPEHGCFPHRDLKYSFKTSSLSLSLGFSRGREDTVVLSHSLQEGAARTAGEAKATHRLFFYTGLSPAASHVSPSSPTITQPFLHWLVCHLNILLFCLSAWSSVSSDTRGHAR